MNGASAALRSVLRFATFRGVSKTDSQTFRMSLGLSTHVVETLAIGRSVGYGSLFWTFYGLKRPVVQNTYKQSSSRILTQHSSEAALSFPFSQNHANVPSTPSGVDPELLDPGITR